MMEYKDIERLTASAKSRIEKALKSGKIDQAEKDGLNMAISDLDAAAALFTALPSRERASSRNFAADRDKYTTPEALKEYVTNALREGVRSGLYFSIIIFDVCNLTESAGKTSGDGHPLTILDLESLVRSSLRRRADLVVHDKGSIFVILPETEREEAGIVAKRLHDILREFLFSRKADKMVEMGFKITSSLEGGSTFEEMLAGAR